MKRQIENKLVLTDERRINNMKKHTFTENEMEVLKQVQNGSLSKTMAAYKLGCAKSAITKWYKQYCEQNTVNCEQNTVNCEQNTVNCEQNTVNCEQNTVNCEQTLADSDNNSASNKPVVAERIVEAKKRLEEDTYNCFYNNQWRFVHPDTLKKTGCKTARDYCFMEEKHNLWWIMARVPDGVKPDQYYKDKFDEKCIQNGGTGFYKNI